MFASTVEFNIGGRPRYTTCLGCLCTLAILILTLVFALYQVRMTLLTKAVPIVHSHTTPEYFQPTFGEEKSQTKVKQEGDDFHIAVALTSLEDFKSGQTTSDQSKNIQFDLYYRLV